MGHVEYYLQYKHQPYIYREGANPGELKYYMQIWNMYLSVVSIIELIRFIS